MNRFYYYLDICFFMKLWSSVCPCAEHLCGSLTFFHAGCCRQVQRLGLCDVMYLCPATHIFSYMWSGSKMHSMIFRWAITKVLDVLLYMTLIMYLDATSIMKTSFWSVIVLPCNRISVFNKSGLTSWSRNYDQILTLCYCKLFTIK